MIERLIKPLIYLKANEPLIFLAGPVQGTYNWHDKSIEIIKAEAPELYIASPNGNLNRKCKKDNSIIQLHNKQIYLDKEQTDWETYHLRKAAENGAILFWFANETNHRCDKPYAGTSGIELGEVKAWHEAYGIPLVVGIEKGFQNLDYIKQRFSQDCPDVPICSKLEDICKEAIKLVRLRQLS